MFPFEIYTHISPLFYVDCIVYLDARYFNIKVQLIQLAAQCAGYHIFLYLNVHIRTLSVLLTSTFVVSLLHLHGYPSSSNHRSIAKAQLTSAS